MRYKIIIENNSPVLIVDKDLFGANLRGSSCQNQLALSKFGIWLACSAGVFFELAIRPRKRHVETSRPKVRVTISTLPNLPLS